MEALQDRASQYISMKSFMLWLENNPEEDAFYRAIRQNPCDKTTWLVFADWLEERGESQRAELIRSVIAYSSNKNRKQAWETMKQFWPTKDSHDLAHAFPFIRASYYYDMDLDKGKQLTQLLRSRDDPEDIMSQANELMGGLWY